MKIGIIGIGMMGASMALAWKNSKENKKNKENDTDYLPDLHLGVCDANPSHLQTARNMDLADNYYDDATSLTKDGYDIIIFCTPIRAMPAIAAQIAPHLPAGCIISDIGSVKSYIYDQIKDIIPQNCHFIPGHPVAGQESSGPENGRSDLFVGRNFILCPPEGTSRNALTTLKKAIASLKPDQIMETSVVTHDQALAFTSHLPHIIAFAAMNESDAISQRLGLDISQFNGGSYEDMTRVAAADPIMWRDVFLTNKAAIKTGLSHLIDHLHDMMHIIDRADDMNDDQILYEKIVYSRQLKIAQLQKKMKNKKT